LLSKALFKNAEFHMIGIRYKVIYSLIDFTHLKAKAKIISR